MMPPWRRQTSSILKLLFAGLLLVVLLRALNLREAVLILGHVEPIAIVGVLALFGAGVLLSCVRWRLALSQLLADPPSLSMLVRLYMIGSFVNLGLPTMAGGDIVRAELMREQVGQRSVAYASILTDRLIGILAVVVIGTAALLFAGPLLDRSIRVLVQAVGLVVVAVVALLLLALRSSIPVPQPFRHVVSLLEPMQILARRPGILGASLTIAIVVQAACVVLPIAILAEAMDIEVPFSVHFALVPVTIIAALIPVAPSGLGVRETAFVLLYSQLGVPAEKAFALGLSWSLVLLAFGLVGGVLMASAVRPMRSGSH